MPLTRAGGGQSRRKSGIVCARGSTVGWVYTAAYLSVRRRNRRRLGRSCAVGTGFQGKSCVVVQKTLFVTGPLRNGIQPHGAWNIGGVREKRRLAEKSGGEVSSTRNPESGAAWGEMAEVQ